MTTKTSTKISTALAGGCCLLLLTAQLVACDKGPTKTSAAPAATASAPSTPTAPAVAAPSTPTSAPAVAAPATASGTSFGAALTATDSVTVDAVLADPQTFKGKTVRVEGMITDVCPKRGCWFELAGSAPGQKLRFKVNDGEMVFPMDAKGKYAVAEGVVAVRELSIEESKAYAEYQAKEYKIAYDPASITKPTSVVRIDGTGAVLRDKK